MSGEEASTIFDFDGPFEEDFNKIPYGAEKTYKKTDDYMVFQGQHWKEVIVLECVCQKTDKKCEEEAAKDSFPGFG